MELTVPWHSFYLERGGSDWSYDWQACIGDERRIEECWRKIIESCYIFTAHRLNLREYKTYITGIGGAFPYLQHYVLS